jgi:hypothetical protein
VDAQATTGDIAGVTLLFVSLRGGLPKECFIGLRIGVLSPWQVRKNGMKLLFIG